MRLVSKQVKNMVDKQVTCISPYTISSKRLVAASRQFPKIDTLSLKQTIMQDDLVYIDDGNNEEEKEKPKEEKSNIDQQQAIVIHVDQFFNFHNLKSLQLQYCFQQHRNVCKLISVLSHRISNLEIEFVRQQSGSKQEDILFLLNSLRKLNNLKILTLNNEANCNYNYVDVIPIIAQLIQLEELHVFGRFGKGNQNCGQLTALQNLRKIYVQSISSSPIYFGQLETVQDWVNFLSHFKFLHSFMLYDGGQYAWKLLEALVQFPNIQTVGIALNTKYNYNIDILHQHHVDVLVQISKIKSQLYVQLGLLCTEYYIDYLRAVPTTCIQALNLLNPSKKVCQYLRSANRNRGDDIPYSNLQVLSFRQKHELSIASMFSLDSLKQLTHVVYFTQNDQGTSSLCSLPNLKHLRLIHPHNNNLNASDLQNLSSLCAKGILQHLDINYEDFSTTLADSICVPGCNLRRIIVEKLTKVENIVEFKCILSYMFDKFEFVVGRIPHVYVKPREDLFQIIQEERYRRLFNTFSGKSFQKVKQA
eukprot:TRINITY_DN3588_c0_g1_i5.p1 TRINITY_DN3588_c0_g1~~TRINITY_DN3588_c0_g1_i5.p1  ORF type:complete len:598 (-),score=5.51 TRINITY_DN3588_c0_g1_i5:684-2279(-)